MSMRTGLFIIAALALSLAGGELTAKDSCPKGEEIVSSMPEVRPGWVDSPHLSLGKEERFVGLSTQNDRLEAGISAAVENANSSIMDAVGRVLQGKVEGVLTLDAGDVRRVFGSRGATTYLRKKDRRAIYSEKWASYHNCRPQYFYNVWVLIAVPKAEIEAEAIKAMGFLQGLQNRENQGGGTGILPAEEATHIKEVPVKKGKKGEVAPQEEIPVYVPPVVAPFRCTSVSLQGGYTHLVKDVRTGVERFKQGAFNFSVDGEWGLSENICMGTGIGYAAIQSPLGGFGHIIPFFVSVKYKAPLGSTNRFIPWIGAEVGPAVLYGFKKDLYRDSWSGQVVVDNQKEVGLWVGGAAGIDIRLQRSLTMTINAGYYVTFASQTNQTLLGRVGIRYYFW